MAESCGPVVDLTSWMTLSVSEHRLLSAAVASSVSTAVPHQPRRPGVGVMSRPPRPVPCLPKSNLQPVHDTIQFTQRIGYIYTSRMGRMAWERENGCAVYTSNNNNNNTSFNSVKSQHRLSLRLSRTTAVHELCLVCHAGQPMVLDQRWAAADSDLGQPT